MGTKWGDEGVLGDTYINIYQGMVWDLMNPRIRTLDTYTIDTGTWLDKTSMDNVTRSARYMTGNQRHFHRSREAAMKAAEKVFGKIEWQEENEHGTTTGYAWGKDNPHLVTWAEEKLAEGQAKVAEREARKAERKAVRQK